ncbi:MAG: hypothetical protein ROW48_13685 [Bellilinea sp.]
MAIRLAARSDDFGDAARLTGKLAPTTFKSFIARNFRENLRRLTGKSLDEIVGLEAHHVLPRKFARDFTEVGINIHDPLFGSWVNPKAHRQWSYAYNQRWIDFLDRKPTQQEVLNFVHKLAQEYGFDVYLPIP